MGHSSCCVVGCTNTGRNSNCKFYTFPTAKWKLEQRKKWINAVKRKNPDGSPWYPKRSDHICSDHFVGGKKSEEELSPGYTPTIFPSTYGKSKINELTALNRHKRFMERRFPKQNATTSVSSGNDKMMLKIEETTIVESADAHCSTKIDRGCQANIFFEQTETDRTFICNRYIYHNTCDAQIQTSITDCIESGWITSTTKFNEKCCGTDKKIPIDKSVGTDNKCFYGFRSIRKDDQLFELAGVTFNNFECLLKKMGSLNKFMVAKEDRLFIFLMKIKTGLTFSTLSVLFDVHRSTISRIFYSTLQDLVSGTANLIFLPSSEAVIATMPSFFRPDYIYTRVIIDCIELKVEVPNNIDKSLYVCRNNQKAFMAKVFIGITPGGFHCFKSKTVGGRTSSLKLIAESGLLDKLEDGDVILTDKEYFTIKAAIDQSEKRVTVVTPTRSEKKTKSSEPEIKKPANIAKVKIHVEKMMEKLKVYRILDKLPENLFNCIDDIIHICCILTNLHQEK